MCKIKEVCEPHERRKAINDILHFERNPSSVRIVTYSFTDPISHDIIRSFGSENIEDFKTIISRLCAKRERVITLIVNHKQIGEDSEDILKFMFNLGVNIYYNSNVHAKIIFAKCKDENSIYLTSSNITNAGVNKRFEIGVILSSGNNAFKSIDTYIDKIIGTSMPEDGKFDIFNFLNKRIEQEEN